MQKKRAFTLIELLVVISIIALLIGILLPALAAARKTAKQMQNSTQVRGIHSGLVIYAQGNSSYYVGINSVGLASTTGGMTGQGRAYTLVADAFFTTDYTQSPLESTPSIPSALAGIANTIPTSYAFLQISSPLGVIMLGGSRITEWKDTTNSQAIEVSDRMKLGTGGTPTTYQSISTNTNGDWRGSVGYNDNHVNFEAKAVLTTLYGLDTAQNNTDDLFAAGNASTTTSQYTGATAVNSDTNGNMDDALMAWNDTVDP